MVLTYNGKDCKVEIYIDGETPGSTPDGNPETWATVAQVMAVATGLDINTSKDVAPKYGINNSTPQLLKEGNIGYDWSVESLYTTQLFGETADTDALKLIDEGEKFAMKLTVFDEGDSEDMNIILTYCRASTDNLSVSDDGDLTCSLSGQAKTRTITVV